MKKFLITIVISAVVFGTAGFFAGSKYQQAKTQSRLRQFTMGRQTGEGNTFQNRLRTGFRPVSGEIIEKDEKSLTVKMTDGSSKIVFLSENTQINKAEKADKEDLKVGEKIAVFGVENSDGSLTAQSIQLNPQEQGMFGPRSSQQ